MMNRSIVVAFALLVGCVQSKIIELSLLDQFGGASGSEIGAYDVCTKTAYVTSLEGEVIVLNMTNPAKIVQSGSLTVTGAPNSVAVYGKTNTIAIASMDAALGQGYITIIEGGKKTTIKTRYGPDMITFSKSGKKILAAIEGEVDDNDVNHPGSIAVLDVATKKINYRGFASLDSRVAELKEQGMFFNKRPSIDVEPEYLAVVGRYVYASLQENNGIARIDLAQLRRPPVVYPLGLKDHSIKGNGIDASDEDGGFNLKTWPVFGAYQPDTIKAFEQDGARYIVMANEGDARDDARIEDIVLDPVAFPNAAELQAPEALGRLQVIPCNSCKTYKKLVAFGARSFSIFKEDANGFTLTFDSGDDLETLTHELLGENFNSDHEENGGDARSDNKGPEPEALEIGIVDGYRYAFIGLERVGGIMVYDITIPSRSKFVTYFNNRDFDVPAEECTTCDLGPESIVFIPAGNSPNGKNLLMVANEVSKTTSIYSITSDKSAPGPLAPELETC